MLALPRMTGLPEEAGTRIPGSRSAGVKLKADNPFVKMLEGLTTPKKSLSTETKSAIANGIEQTSKSKNLAATGHTGLAQQRLPGSESGKVREAVDGKQAEPAQTGQSRTAKADASKGIVPDGAGRNSARQKDMPVREESVDSSAAAAMFVQSLEAKVPARESPSRTAGTPKTGAMENSGLENLGTVTEKGKDGARIVVMDMRLKAGAEAVSRRDAAKPRSGAQQRDDGSTSDVSKQERTFDATRSTGNLTSSSSNIPAQPDLSAPEVPASSQKSMSESLATRLRDGATDIVRSAQIVLRDGDSGLIRLRLEPESLGGVKIELKMTEKQISGKIVVESDIAGEAFRSSLDALKDAFAESGFETTSLEVEVRNGMAYGPEAGNHGADGESGEGAPYWSESLKKLDEAVPTMISRSRDGLLDFLV